jgi:hypothetical protein
VIRGYVGGGSIGGGTLIDEDFSPGVSPYSSTTSAQRGGTLGYASIDLGYNVISAPTGKLGAFFGYHYLGEDAHAFGCAQNAGSPICATTIPDSIRVITESGGWHSLRIGIAGEVTVFDRLKLAANAAWVPLSSLSTFDTHWLRTGTAIGDFAGPIPQAVHGNGVQLEAFASYRVTDCFSLGVGGRYWKLQGKGTAALEQTIVGLPPDLAVAQPLTFQTERYGAYLQAAYRFGDR